LNITIKKKLQSLFKKFFYSIFHLIYGRINDSIVGDEKNRIKVTNLTIEKNWNYKIYQVKDGRLYTDRVRDLAVILDNNIIEGPSYQLRKKNINSDIKNNVVFEKGTPRVLKKIKGKVLSVITGGGGNDNYWHWLYDVLPRLKICEKVINLESIDYFIFPDTKKRFQSETLKELNFPNNKVLSSEKFRHLKAEELIITNHPYNFTDDPHYDAQHIPKWIIQWLKDKFLKTLKSTNKNYPKNIYIDRSDSESNVSHLRKIINEKEIIELLKREKFTPVRLSDLSFLDQVQYFNNAERIVGLHGAGFANLSFCKEKTKIIEFRMTDTGKVIENLAATNNLEFNSIICKPISHALGVQLGYIKIPIEILEKKIKDY